MSTAAAFRSTPPDSTASCSATLSFSSQTGHTLTRRMSHRTAHMHTHTHTITHTHTPRTPPVAAVAVRVTRTLPLELPRQSSSCMPTCSSWPCSSSSCWRSYSSRWQLQALQHSSCWMRSPPHSPHPHLRQQKRNQTTAQVRSQQACWQVWLQSLLQLRKQLPQLQRQLHLQQLPRLPQPVQ